MQTARENSEQPHHNPGNRHKGQEGEQSRQIEAHERGRGDETDSRAVSRDAQQQTYWPNQLADAEFFERLRQAMNEPSHNAKQRSQDKPAEVAEGWNQ